jgi:hypothetical protein
MKVLIQKDGFTWIIVNEIAIAKEIWTAGIQMYRLYDDGGEGLILTEEELNEAIDTGMDIGIEPESTIYESKLEERPFLFVQVVQAASESEAEDKARNGNFDELHPYNGILATPEQISEKLNQA